jgi:two-component system sensor histidine kinase CpxA
MTLRRKILGLGLLNLLLVAAAVFFFGRFYYGLGPESILVGPARDRMVAIGDSFAAEFRLGADRDALVLRYAREYEVDVTLIAPWGERIAGPELPLPRPLMARIREGGGPPGPPGDRRPPEGPPGEGLPGDGPPPDRRKLGERGPRERFFFVATSNPTYYWSGIRIPLITGDRDEPGVLLLRSASLFSSKLFFNWRPWVGLAAALAGVTALCWVPFLGRLTKTIQQMSRVTEQVAQGRFDGRVEVNRRDELGHLGDQVNVMAERLEDFVRSQKRFLGDTAHELSAPIARVQFALGILEQRVDDGRASDIATLHEEVQEMSQLVAELLSFSRIGMETSAAALAPVNLAEITRRAAAREAVTADVTIDESLMAIGHERYLTRAIGNLLRNAARYASDAGPISVHAARQGDKVELVVADHGPGLPPEALEKIFEPFYRLQSSRSRDTGGVGLGLAIVKSCVEACRGAVACRNRAPHGLEVVITLDAAVRT